jgi:hypothetical protein
MDNGTIVLISLLAAAMSWWLAILINENIQIVRQDKNDETERLKRAEKVKNLTNRHN